MTPRIIFYFIVLSVCMAFTAHSQVTRSFSERASFNTNGNITMVGNTLLTCDSANFDCAGLQSGTISGTNATDMVYINVDGATGYNNTSSATLTIPNGASVLHAELYWGGRNGATTTNRDKIRIKPPGSSSYTRITAHTIDTFTTEGAMGSRPFQASADVTQIVSNAGSGTYTVGDLKAITGVDGLGYYGGWALAVVYQDNTEPFRRLMLFDGAARVVGSNTVSITTSNLITPYSGSFDTYLGAVVWEGDQSLTGDSFVFENTTISDSLNPANNFWNSSFTSFNTRMTNKSPDYVNQLGMDLVMSDVSGILANGETQANIDFVTDGDSYFPQALAFVSDLYLPDFDSSMDKVAIDLNGGQVEPGDVIEYRVAFENTGQDTAINTVLTDSLPNGVSYVPNSLEIVSATAGPAGSMSDVSGDDAAEYDSNSNAITFWVGANAAFNQGGDFAPNESAVIKFLAVVDDQNSGSITNTANIDFNAQTTPDESLEAEDDAVINVVGSASINVTKTAQLTIDNGNPGTADAGDEITFTIDVDNTGSLSMNNINISDAMAPLGVNCPASSLAGYDSMSCDSYIYTVTQNDIDNGGSIDNTVNLTATDGTGANHQDADSTQTILTFATPIISVPTDGDLLNDNTPTVSGTGPVGAQIDVLTDQGNSCQAIVDGAGNWTCDISPGLTDGVIFISAFASDGGSNQSSTDSVTVNLDTTAPDAPGVDAPTNGQPITGIGEPGATVTVTTESGGGCTAIVQANGTWSCTLAGPFADEDDITVTQEDDAGNVSPPTVVPNGVDIQAPTLNIITPVDGALTNDNTPTVSGTSEPGAAISVTIGGVEVYTAVADGNGDWACDVSPAVADGSVQIDVTASDEAGNTSNPESVTITVDATAPDAPVINAPTNGQPVTGIGEPGATVDVTTPGGASCTATVQANGTWSCTTLTGNLVNGDDISATQTDEAGNESDPITVSNGLDTQAPIAPTIETPVNGTTINNPHPIVRGTAEANSYVSVTNQTGAVCVAQTNTGGQWSCTTTSALADGLQQFEAVSSDEAGNESQPATSNFNVNSGAGYILSVNASAQLTTTEGGDSDTFTIELPLTPSSDVTVNISSSDTSEGTVSPGTVTFTPSNWNQPVTITVTGVDDPDYDLDQNYTIDFSPLSSLDSNYDGYQAASVDAVNEDDDAQPDLAVFITNCINGSLPQQAITYYVTVSNEGNKAIQNARLTTQFPNNMTEPTWECALENGQSCLTSTGQGNLDESIDLNVGESMMYTLSADVIGQLHDFLDVSATIQMPLDETDVNPNDNQAEDSDLLYQFIYKHGFDCAAPGTIESTTQQLEQLFNLK